MTADTPGGGADPGVPVPPPFAQPYPQPIYGLPYPQSAPPHPAQPVSGPYGGPPVSGPYGGPPVSGPYGGPPVSGPYGGPYGGQPVSGPYGGLYGGQPGVQPGYPWVLPPAYQPPRRNSWARWLVGTFAVLLVCTVGAVGGLVGYADYTGALDTQASWRPAGAAPSAPLPAQNAPASVWTTWARRTVGDAVTSQGKALLAGDEKAFLSIVDPSNARLVTNQRQRYAALHAMGLGVWTQTISGGVRDKGTVGGSRSWTADIKISYCFGEPSCTTVQIVSASTWQVKQDRIVMAAMEASDSDWNGPRPWETDELTVRTGKRVVLAATKSNAWRLPDAVNFADQAALVADKFGKWEPPPSRYVIFFAAPGDWKRWYGHEQPEWAAAWAVPVSSTVTEVVVRSQAVFQADLKTLLTHELTHVTTLAGKRDGADNAAWWLIEGIAEYSSMLGRPVIDYDGIVGTRAFVRGPWNGDAAISPPTDSSTQEDAAGRYGVAFLAVRRIAEKYGEAKMLTFFGNVVHDAESFETASRSALGAPWSTVKTDCAKYIRSAVASTS